ncbi:lipid-A-disaccharide synthetase family protein [Chlamydia ibidis]|uniref:Lipid-A-disaccharide synthase n=2 Tax=Chlamydia ibidis TaxID=1405396 RepID=S7J478_9CHLA|nr:lipid-A-disaccharide synthase N-terminal domain-containing protein [Chlamydia ibidis]EPP34817.1 lipid-A-disaccharide synthetase family protein [Chlamydia ibidis]EQM62369.1 lipid-A-disaccharide synthetase family protein [Chlamydia ibidis 10-1398/6]
MFSSCFVQSLYPLGLVANVFFGLAFTVQWLISQKHHQGYVPKAFWILSSIGSSMMVIHGFIQSQFPISLLHTANVVIYFRNLNLGSRRPLSLRTTIITLIIALLLTTFPFVLVAYFFPETSWMSSPDLFHLPLPPPNIYWHLLGCTGLCIYSSRFFIQWCYLELHNRSALPQLFWQVGLCGAFLSFLYFLRTGDPVNVLSYGCGLIPPLANLRIVYKKANKSIPHNHSCFLSCGEPSGDNLGERIIDTLSSSYPDMEIFGVGGPLMRAKKLRTVIPMEEFQVSGFLEIFGSIFRLFRAYRFLLKEIIKTNPKMVICIDFPDFHFLLIKGLRKRGYQGKIIHYVCPSIWAWRPQRKKFLEKYLDALLLILPFEKDIFSTSSLPTSYVGHPLVEAIENHQYRKNWKKELNISESPIIAAFPGSRRGDIVRNLEIQVRAFLASSFKDSHQLLVSSSSPKFDKMIQDVLAKEGCLQANIVPVQFRYELMKDCDCALAKCGTIVLETALNYTPTIVTCLLRPFDILLAKYIFKIFIPAYSLPNIITKSVIFPEFIGGKNDFSFDEVASALDILANPNQIEKQKQKCSQLYQMMHRGIDPLDRTIQKLVEPTSQPSANNGDPETSLRESQETLGAIVNLKS